MKIDESALRMTKNSNDLERTNEEMQLD